MHITLKYSKACEKEIFIFSLCLQRQINQCVKEGRGEEKNEMSIQTLI